MVSAGVHANREYLCAMHYVEHEIIPWRIYTMSLHLTYKMFESGSYATFPYYSKAKHFVGSSGHRTFSVKIRTVPPKSGRLDSL